MPDQSDFTPELLAECDAIRLNEGGCLTYEERVARWQIFHERCYQDGQWKVSALDAILPASLGAALASERKDWSGATKLIDQYMTHHDLSLILDGPEFFNMSVIGIIPGILSGKITETARENLRLINEQTFGRFTQLFVSLSLGCLCGALIELDSDAVVDEDIRQFAADLVSRFDSFETRTGEVIDTKSNQETMALISSILSIHRQK